MNRKLRNTILAFSVTGMLLALGLVAAAPADSAQPLAPALADHAVPGGQPHGALMPVAEDAAPALHEHADALRRDAGAVEPAPVPHADAEQAAAELLAAMAAGATLAGSRADAGEDSPTPRIRRSGHVRKAIAVPYFSFARGMGRAGRS